MLKAIIYFSLNLSLFISISNTVFSQELPTRFAIHGVCGMSTSIPFKTSSSSFNSSYYKILPKISPLVGINYQNRLTEKINYSVGFSYKDVGYRLHNYELPTGEFFIDFIQTIRISSFEFPLSVVIPMKNEKLNICLGINPYYQKTRVMIGEFKDFYSYELDSFYYEQSGHFYPKDIISANIFAGFSYQLNNSLGIKLIYMQGFSKVAAMDNSLKASNDPVFVDIFAYIEPRLSTIDLSLEISINRLRLRKR
ncbi:MAG: hypothetical protein HOD63_13960 [Bacteroidetes bacterium]|jgi:hypothetical protein|nr:hypothetical protein [Bacteroidota bacterium]MBT5528155.1 hypothetical protein [Cytophagia bacterium]MBT3424720.1 hypothetical protein [Bacteroidota bacterium]MBT3799861.1 hypothetical protein [Bacteroidota bacterium]MBT3935519.1 hypothetical protein [Bacteroidota bacterium]